MNNDSHSYPFSFIQLATEMGRFILGSRISDNPVNAAEHILEEFKAAARYLRSACSITQSEALEALSIASVFKHWHDLQQHLKQSKTFVHKAHEQWVERFSGLSPLLIDIDPGEKPNERAQDKIIQFTTRLCNLLGCPPQVVLNGLFARICHASQWQAVISRHPINAHEPYYHFVPADQFNGGHFAQSSASFDLYEELENGLDLETDDGINEFANRLKETVEKRPDYIEGWLILSELFLEDYPDIALHYANSGIEMAEGLLPKRFRSKLEWGFHPNRHYLRLLQHKMMSHEELIDDDPKHLDHAIKCAKKIIRLSSALKELASEHLCDYNEMKSSKLDNYDSSL